ncbi:MAG: glycosyltransferase family 1 protein [Candidatus Hydrogenedentota bacterium]
MQLGFDISSLTPARTGVGNYVFELGCALLRIDSEFELHGYATGRRAVDVSGMSHPMAYRQVHIPTSVLYKCWRYFRHPSVEFLLGRDLDVVHGTNFYLPETRRAKRIISVHDISFEVHPEWVNQRVVSPYASQIEEFCDEADGIITFSEFTKAEMVSHYETEPDKIHVTPHGIRSDWCRFGDEAAKARVAELGIQGAYVLYVGTIEERKNIRRMLEAFALLENYPHRLVLVGNEGWMSTSLTQLIEDLKLSDRVLLPGYIPHEDLSALYKAADAFVFPSLYEGFGFPVLEAFACGCPVITSNTTSLPEVGGDVVEYVDPMEVLDIARGIEAVIGDTDYARDLGRRGHERMRLFDWSETARETVDVYRSVLA